MDKSHGITVKVLGDYGPFSRIGKSIGYQVTIGNSSYLVDCGSPVFQRIGGHGLKEIKGLIITHCHDDHKRWFSDFALFNRYAPDVGKRLPLMTSERVNNGLAAGSAPSLAFSLADDCRRVIDIAYDEYVDFTSIAPRAKFRIEQLPAGAGLTRLAVVALDGSIVPPEQAKIFIGASGLPRLLFRDPPSGEWVEPESFYPFSSGLFYDSDWTPFVDPAGFTIEAINAPVWHGMPSIGVKFSTGSETVIFSSDTNHDLELWEGLYREKIPQQLRMSAADFAAAPVICGDINDYIERIWSEARFNDAVATFSSGIIIHDIAAGKSVVHTDYRRLDHTTLDRKRTILTHSPDKMTSAWLLNEAEKEFLVSGDGFAELVAGTPLPIIGDFFHKENGRYFVCFRNDAGHYAIYENDLVLSLASDPYRGNGELVSRVDIYENIAGQYLPLLDEGEAEYLRRPDGRIEAVEYTPEGSIGRIAEDQRPRLTAAHAGKV
jgi:hypothetical protein